MLTEARNRPGAQRSVLDDEVRRRGIDTAHGAGRCGASSGVWVARLDSWWTWDGTARVKEVRRSTAARNWGGGRAHLRFVWVKIPANPIARHRGKGRRRFTAAACATNASKKVILPKVVH